MRARTEGNVLLEVGTVDNAELRKRCWAGVEVWLQPAVSFDLEWTVPGFDPKQEKHSHLHVALPICVSAPSLIGGTSLRGLSLE